MTGYFHHTGQMSWKMRNAGWNRGMKRVRLANGRYTYRYPGDTGQHDGMKTVLGFGLAFMLPSMAGGPVGLIVFGPVLFVIGAVVGAIVAAATKP